MVQNANLREHGIPMWILLVRAGELVVCECADPWGQAQDGGLLAIRATRREADSERDRINALLAAAANGLSPYQIPRRSLGLAAGCS